MSYKHIKAADRIVIATLLDERRTNTYVARRLGVDRSSIGLEITRNGDKSRPEVVNPVTRSKILDIDGRKLRGSGFTKTKYKAIDCHQLPQSIDVVTHPWHYTTSFRECHDRSNLCGESASHNLRHPRRH